MTADVFMFSLDFFCFVFLKINMQSFLGDQTIAKLCSSKNTDSREICFFTVQSVLFHQCHIHIFFRFPLNLAV